MLFCSIYLNYLFIYPVRDKLAKNLPFRLEFIDSFTASPASTSNRIRLSTVSIDTGPFSGPRFIKPHSLPLCDLIDFSFGLCGLRDHFLNASSLLIGSLTWAFGLRVAVFDSLHLHKMLQHFICQCLIDLHLFALEHHQRLTYLIGIDTFNGRQIPPTLVHMDKITICRCHLLPHPPQLHLSPHLIQKGPLGMKFIKLFE